jgi:peptide/nickel transport system substrate-binding protein
MRKPDGFTTGVSYQAERPNEKAAAEALQQSLARAGITLQLQPYPAEDYYRLYAGNLAFVKANNIGLIVTGWNADWPDGFGFLAQIVDSRVIRGAGNTNLGSSTRRSTPSSTRRCGPRIRPHARSSGSTSIAR